MKLYAQIFGRYEIVSAVVGYNADNTAEVIIRAPYGTVTVPTNNLIAIRTDAL